MGDKNTEYSLLGHHNISLDTNDNTKATAAMCELFLKFVSTSRELKSIASILGVEICVVSKIPYGKTSKFFIKKPSTYLLTSTVSFALHKIESPQPRCTIHRMNDGRYLYAIPIFLNGDCIAYLLMGTFYIDDEENMIPDIPKLSIKQCDNTCNEVCAICNKLLASACKYTKKQDADIYYDSRMLFEYGSFYDYDLIADQFILSKKTAEIFGWDCNSKFNYQDFVGSIIESDRQRLTMLMRDKVMLGSDDYVIDTTILRKPDGKPVSIEITGTIIKDSNGFNIRALGAITDISMLKKTQEHLKEEIDSKNRLIRIIGHDLKNPFNGLIGFSEILKSNLESQNYTDARDLAEIIKKCATEGYDLLVNILDYSTSQSSNLKADNSEFDLYKTVDSIMMLSSAQAMKKGITIHNSIPECTMLYSDEYKISTVIRNLVSNAIKFCFKNGVVIVEASYDNEGIIRISVSDTGEQLTKDKLDKINRCKDVESTYGTANEKGTSIGLKLCHSFLKVLDSKLTAYCDDGITTFYFDIRTNL